MSYTTTRVVAITLEYARVLVLPGSMVLSLWSLHPASGSIIWGGSEERVGWIVELSCYTSLYLLEVQQEAGGNFEVVFPL